MSKDKPIFNRKEATGLAKRFVKPEQYDPKRDVMVMYMLFNAILAFIDWMKKRKWNTRRIGNILFILSSIVICFFIGHEIVWPTILKFFI